MKKLGHRKTPSRVAGHQNCAVSHPVREPNKALEDRRASKEIEAGVEERQEELDPPWDDELDSEEEARRMWSHADREAYLVMATKFFSDALAVRWFRRQSLDWFRVRHLLKINGCEEEWERWKRER